MRRVTLSDGRKGVFHQFSIDNKDSNYRENYIVALIEFNDGRVDAVQLHDFTFDDPAMKEGDT